MLEGLRLSARMLKRMVAVEGLPMPVRQTRLAAAAAGYFQLAARALALAVLLAAVLPFQVEIQIRALEELAA
jgi:hypothetical protein